MPDKKTFPRSYSLYQIVARLFDHEDDEGLNPEDALPCLKFILEQATLDGCLKAFFEGKPVYFTAKDSKGHLTLPEGYPGFARFRDENKDPQEQAKNLRIKRDGWRSYLERLRKEAKDFADRPDDESWDVVFVKNGVHPQDRVDEIKEHLQGLNKTKRQEHLKSYGEQAKKMKESERDYIESANIILEQYKNHPFWEDTAGKTGIIPAKKRGAKPDKERNTALAYMRERVAKDKNVTLSSIIEGMNGRKINHKRWEVKTLANMLSGVKKNLSDK